MCGHIVALLFRVEAAVSLGVNQKDPEHGSSKLAVWDKYYRPAVSPSVIRCSTCDIINLPISLPETTPYFDRKRNLSLNKEEALHGDLT